MVSATRLPFVGTKLGVRGAVDRWCPIVTPDVLEDGGAVLSPDIGTRIAPSAHRALLAVALAAPVKRMRVVSTFEFELR
jgi:hypothetical protein